MNKILFSILGAFMVSTMASAQYLNVKLDDGTYHSYKTSSDMEVSFGAKKGADVTESGQMIKIYHGDQLVTKYKLLEGDKVVYEEAPVLGTTGSAQRMGNIEVNWIQLWEGGPRFAEYNVGVTDGKAESYGLHYRGADNAATGNWGDNWRMPTSEEFQALIANCDVTWTTDYNNSGIMGKIFTGKGYYSGNSIFLPAAGYYSYLDNKVVKGKPRENNPNIYDYYGCYWTSTPDVTTGDENAAFYLTFTTGYMPHMDTTGRHTGSSVRAVLKEE